MYTYIHSHKSYRGCLFLIIFLFSECTIYINSKDIAHAACESQKMSKREAATVALDKLRKRCYTIKVMITNIHLSDERIYIDSYYSLLCEYTFYKK